MLDGCPAVRGCQPLMLLHPRLAAMPWRAVHVRVQCTVGRLCTNHLNRGTHMHGAWTWRVSCCRRCCSAVVWRTVRLEVTADASCLHRRRLSASTADACSREVTTGAAKANPSAAPIASLCLVWKQRHINKHHQQLSAPNIMSPTKPQCLQRTVCSHSVCRTLFAATVSTVCSTPHVIMSLSLARKWAVSPV